MKICRRASALTAAACDGLRSSKNGKIRCSARNAWVRSRSEVYAIRANHSTWTTLHSDANNSACVVGSAEVILEILYLGDGGLTPGNRKLGKSTLPVNAASSTGRCNTIQCIDSTMLLREKHLFGCTWLKPSQGSIPVGLDLASDFGFCFQCQAGSSLVLRRPMEITALIRWDEKAGLPRDAIRSQGSTRSKRTRKGDRQ